MKKLLVVTYEAGVEKVHGAFDLLRRDNAQNFAQSVGGKVVERESSLPSKEEVQQ